MYNKVYKFLIFIVIFLLQYNLINGRECEKEPFYKYKINDTDLFINFYHDDCNRLTYYCYYNNRYQNVTINGADIKAVISDDYLSTNDTGIFIPDEAIEKACDILKNEFGKEKSNGFKNNIKYYFIQSLYTFFVIALLLNLF